ncbi:glucosyl-dolichyl phosphate glucuronosyltransferase [Salinarchaeum laminariae]|uniref:glucosyl-dolichyl phosphate glucuronosyltransferase n=1 Tax=Salinarchaeum laminariae TaxID=869888 RepID=UPI0020BD4EA8|nr:glucosyl-dolichyl phosphate glucuronosyltransferase [Salinarchaeum laminariae]
MRVSVVVCVYSMERFDDLVECVESLLAQTYDDVEVVVVVDGTVSVFDRVEHQFDETSNVVLHCNEENVGLLESRNTGAELASGDVVAFIDDDAVADEQWIEKLVNSYEEQDAIAVGGKMTPLWVDGKPGFLPEEFYWLIGVTHRGFADGAGEVRNTFGSNISFDREVFLELGGFDAEIGGRKGDSNLQGGETELCARLREDYGEGVWYNPQAEVGHKVFEYRTKPRWLVDRAFWQGYSKRAMEVLVPNTGGTESDYLRDLVFRSTPRRLRGVLSKDAKRQAVQLLMLWVLTAAVGLGYLYAFRRWR